MLDAQLAQSRGSRLARIPPPKPSSRIVMLVVLLVLIVGALIALQFFLTMLRDSMPERTRPAVIEQSDGSGRIAP